MGHWLTSVPPSDEGRRHGGRGDISDDPLLRNLPLAIEVANRFSRSERLDNQLAEAAIVGLVKAAHSSGQMSEDEFERHVESTVSGELRDFMRDCVHAREDRVFARDQAAVEAMELLTTALLQRQEFHELALLLGLDADGLASGLLLAVVNHPGFLAATT